MLGLAFGESNVMDAVRDELLYGVKDELMGSSDWWGGMVLAPTQPWPHRVDAEAPHSVLSFYEEAVPPEVHRLMRIWFVLGWPAFAALIGIFVLMITKPGF